GAIVLGGEGAAARLLQIGIDQFRADRARFAVGVAVVEQFLSGQVQAALDRTRDARVRHGHVMRHAALAGEAQPQLVAGHCCVAPFQRGQSVRAVGARVLARADAYQGDLEQAHQHGQDLFLRQRGARHVALDLLADARQAGRELCQLVVFAGIAQRGPVRVVAVLFAAPGVAAGGLQVPVRPRAYPDIRIGGRNGQRVDAPDHVPVDDAPSARVEVVEFTRAAAPPAVARPAVVYIDQAGVAGRRVWRLLRVRLLRSCGHGGFYGRFPERYDRGDSGG